MMNNSNCGGCQPDIPVGAPGANGKNAYTVLTASFTQPAVSANVTITVSTAGQFTNAWAVPGQKVFIEGGGEYQVVALVGINQISVTNLGITGNATPGSTISSNGKVSPSGAQGPTGTGTPGTNGIARLISDVTNYSSATTGTGVLLFTGAIPANSLNANGKGLSVRAYWLNAATTSFQTGIGIVFAGQDTCTGVSGYFPLFTQGGVVQGYISLELIRTGTTTATAYSTCSRIEGDVILTEKKLITGLDFTISNNFTVKYFQSTASDAILTGFTADLIQI